MLKNTISTANIFTKNVQKFMSNKTQRYCSEDLKKRYERSQEIQTAFNNEIKNFDTFRLYEDKLLPCYDKVNRDSGTWTKWGRRAILGGITACGWTEQLTQAFGESFIYGDCFIGSLGLVSLAFTERLHQNFMKKLENGVWRMDLNQDKETITVYVGGLSEEDSFVVNIDDIQIIDDEPGVHYKILYEDKNNNEKKNMSDIYLHLNEQVDLIIQQAENLDMKHIIPEDFKPIPNEMLLYYVLHGLSEDVKEFTYLGDDSELESENEFEMVDEIKKNL